MRLQVSARLLAAVLAAALALPSAATAASEPLFPDAEALLARLAEAPADGIPETQVYLRRLRALTADGSSEALAARDALLGEAFVRYANALLGRRADPARLYPRQWFPHRRAGDPEALLTRALAAPRPGQAAAAMLDALQPTHPEYARLRARLARLLATPALVPAARPAAPAAPDPLGVLPRAPLPPLADLPAAADPDEARLLALNLERWRWLPDAFGTPHVLVNLPAYRLAVREPARGGGYAETLVMDATIGQTDAIWRTPVLSDRITRVDFFPTWTPTVTIQREELIPEARQDGGAGLAARGFDVFAGSRRLDPREVDWRRARAGQYRLVQRGGPQAAMGRVKFVMPNPYFILIHDTNTPEEFGAPARALSHGCVRAADVEALATHLLARTAGWREGRVADLLAGPPQTRGVSVGARPWVHLVYFTAWVDERGALQRYDDVYGHDAPLAAALGLR